MKKILIFLIFIPWGIQAQDMIWARIAFSHKGKVNSYFRTEERFYSDLTQKTLLVDGRFSLNTKLSPIAGIGYWAHKDTPEPRIYEGFEYKFLRVLVEERFFDDFKLRIRTRLKLTGDFTETFKLVLSEEIFYQEGFDHNRMCVTLLKKFKSFDIESGYMSYYKDHNQNTFLIFLTWKLP